MEFPQVGDVFEDRYELRAVLGKGGFATVFMALDREMSRDVVIKALTPQDGGYLPTVAARFAREARVFTKLQDPHNITVYDVGQSASGVLYMVFEYVQGRELAVLLKQRGTLPPPVVAHILTQLLQALREAHGLNILHRDIKPANVLVYEYANDPFRVKLLDFGIAKDLRSDAAQLTKTGHVVGTLRYMAPEQIVGSSIGAESDLYSLGLVGYELLCGTPAIAGSKQRELLQNQVSKEPLRVPAHRAPAALRAVIDRMMAREPSDRYSSASDALRDLHRIRAEVLNWSGELAGPPDGEPRHGTPEPEAEERQRATEPRLAQEQSATNDVSVRAPAWWMYLVAVAIALFAVGVGVALLATARDEASVAAPAPAPVSKPSAAVERTPLQPVDELPDEPHVENEQPEGDDGCGRPPPYTGFGSMSQSTLSGAKWAAYIPTNYDPQRRYPIVLMFHRSLRNGHRLLEQSGLTTAAETYGAILIAPHTSNPFGWPPEEMDTVIAAVEHTTATLCIDSRRRYAVGDERGASFLRKLMCVYPISAAAFVFHGEAKTCRPVVPTPRLNIWGRRNRNVPPQGGIGCNPLDGEHSSAQKIENSWRNEYQCEGKSKPWGKFVGGECSIYQDCDVAPFVTCSTDGGNQWPGSHAIVPAEACAHEKPEAEFEYPQAIWKFFTEFEYLLPEEPDGH